MKSSKFSSSGSESSSGTNREPDTSKSNRMWRFFPGGRLRSTRRSKESSQRKRYDRQGKLKLPRRWSTLKAVKWKDSPRESVVDPSKALAAKAVNALF